MPSVIHTLLGLRTDFSLGESVIASEKVAEIAKRLGQTHVAVADTMTVSGLIDISKAAKKAGVELHMGVRLRIIDDPELREKNVNNGAYHLKVYPKNEDGMRQVYALVSRGNEEDRFYFVPRVTLDDVFEHLKAGDVVITTGDSAGLFSHKDYRDTFTRLRREFKHDLFIELLPVPTPYYERLNINALDTGFAYDGMEYIVAYPTHYDDGQYDAFEMNMAIHNKSMTMRPGTMRRPWLKDFLPKTPADLVGRIKETIAGIRVTSLHIDVSPFSGALRTGNDAFLDATPYRWEKAPVALPRLAGDPNAELLRLCQVGARSRLRDVVFGYTPTLEDIRDKYLPRLKYELDVIKTMGFADYFLVTADICIWAKEQGIYVGPGRGSVGGSLIAYLTGITDIDPIRFDLLFERFINPSRNDLPDADLDFMSTRRDEIIKYLEDKYGVTHVAGINNYGVLQAASAIKDAGRVLSIASENLSATKMVPKVHGQPVTLEEALTQVADIQQLAQDYPKVWKNAVAIQGVMRSYGRHASGVIVSGVPIVERAVVERDDSGKSRKVNWDMRVCEEQGLVKLDILGLSTLDILSLAVKQIAVRHGGLKVDLTKIPLDDEKTLRMFSEGKTVGVFQMEGGGARRILKDMAKTSILSFDDLTATNALNRPGPIDAGLVKDYIESRNGDRTVSYPHPLTKKALEPTFGAITYQEQVMRIAVDLCGFSLSDADKLRKTMSKKLPVEMAKFRTMFVGGATNESKFYRVTLDDSSTVDLYHSKKYLVSSGGYHTPAEIERMQLDIVIPTVTV